MERKKRLKVNGKRLKKVTEYASDLLQFKFRGSIIVCDIPLIILE